MKRVLSKRGQFFILAAVIISAIVISLGSTMNYARSNKNPENFYDTSYEVKRETGAVIDYEIYQGFEEGVDLEDFVSAVAKDINDKDPDANFLFIYGNQDKLEFKNYGSEQATVADPNIAKSSVVVPATRRISIKTCGEDSIACTYSSMISKDGEGGEIVGTSGEVIVEVSGKEHTFAVSKHRQVIFIMQKDVKDESYVSVS